MKPPDLTDQFVKVRAYLTDEDFGYEHWRAAQFSAPNVPSSRYAVLAIFQSEAERDQWLAASPPAQEQEPMTTEPTIRRYELDICDACIRLEGEMCHVPGCAFCRRTMQEVGEYLDALLIRPLVDGERIIAQEGKALVTVPNLQPPTGGTRRRSSNGTLDLSALSDGSCVVGGSL